MLRFYVAEGRFGKTVFSFNTTLVKVLCKVSIGYISRIRGFNTTLVKVLWEKLSCFLRSGIVSIQLLLRFYRIGV